MIKKQRDQRSEMGSLKFKFCMVMVNFFVVVIFSSALVEGGDVTYDGRSLIINGTRRILFSGSIHYPRSTPQMWPRLIQKAKQGGIDVIQTYVFWNIHEPIKGHYNFKGRYDLVKFIRAVRDEGLYVSLRIGPFIEAEWQYGGFPFWLHDIPGIVFRSDNEPFKYYMEKYVSKIVNMMKSEKLYASQGGPIILSQIENEYEMVEGAFHEKGPPYVRWAASMAVSLQTGVPWMMCKQQDAPDPVINTCNGMKCGETFLGPNSPNKPSMWTENWTSFYQVYGEEPYVRSAEEIAYAVALFIAKNGSFVNYYMYHGGTNFGRSASSYVTASYYDEAPIDEYGLIREPKWGHLKELHAAIKASLDTLLRGRHISFSLGLLQEAHVFQGGKCVAFLVNHDPWHNAILQFRDFTYELPKQSISILSDCKNVSFNTATVRSQYSQRSARTVQSFTSTDVWRTFLDRVPNINQASFRDNRLLEQLTTTKDKTDYLWYILSYNHTSSDDLHLLHVYSKAHVIHAYVNGVFIGSAHGSHKQQDAVMLNIPIPLTKGQNTISLLSVMVGSPDAGAFLERRYAGLRRVTIFSTRNQPVDLAYQQWGYRVGLIGEKSRIYTNNGSSSVGWEMIQISINQPLTWYKTMFDAPSDKHPVALDLSSMGKGEAWINGKSIGRYWVSFKTYKGRPSQYLYHVPRQFLKPSGNLLVLFEEFGGNPLNITVNTMSVNRVCSMASESDLPLRSSQLRCPEGRRISSIEFASYGRPFGNCVKYSIGSCHSFRSKSVVEKACMGKRRCWIPLSGSIFGGDPCPNTSKSLLVVANCS